MPQLSSVLVTESSPVSPISEMYRSLRTAIRHKGIRPEAAKGTVLMVASPREQEGRTTTVSNLAVTYAQEGKEVIVLDCNLRKPSLHDIFELTNDAGLVQYLKSSLPLQEVIFPSNTPNLAVMPAGGKPGNPSELLGSARMAELLCELKQHYDVILLDSPSALDYTDAELLAENSDGVLLVARYGKTKREWAKKARAVLERAGANMLGIVINKN